MPPWAGIVVAIVSAIVFPAIGLAVSWGALGIRIRNLETLPTRLDDLAKLVNTLDARTAASASSQGERVARAQTEVDKLTGKVEGLDRGFALATAAIKRKDTSARGHAMGGKDEK